MTSYISNVKAVDSLKIVAESFTKKNSQSNGHLYVFIDPKSKELSTTDKKRKALPFEQISEFVIKIITDQAISKEDKIQSLRNYKVIKEQFSKEKTKTNLIAKIFSSLFASVKKRILEEADMEIFIMELRLGVQTPSMSKIDFINELKAKNLIDDKQASQCKTLADCRTLYKRLSLKFHPDRTPDDEELKKLNEEKFKELNKIWTNFCNQIKQATGKGVNTNLLQDLDKKYQ